MLHNVVAAVAIAGIEGNTRKKAIVNTFDADKKLDHVDFDLNYFGNYFCGSFFLKNYHLNLPDLQIYLLVSCT